LSFVFCLLIHLSYLYPLVLSPLYFNPNKKDMSDLPENSKNRLKPIRLPLILTLTALLMFGFTGSFNETNSNQKGKSDGDKNMVGTWSTAPQLVEPKNMPPEPGLANNTLRQVVRVSIGGKKLQLKFSNEFSAGDLQMKSVQIAVSTGGSKIDPSTVKLLTFNGKTDVVINPGMTITSDPVAFNLKPRTDLAITIYYGQVPKDLTGHPGSRTTSCILAGNSNFSPDFAVSVPTDHWYTITGIDVKSAKAAAVAIIGNSITDGRGSGTNKQNRWPDILSERLVKNKPTKNVGVLNLGIGGNCVLKTCLGSAAIDRFKRDILDQKGVRWLIILEGVNDIGQAPDSITADQVATDLIEAYKKMADQAHAKNIRVYGATILPFGKSFYYKSFREEARKRVNEWILRNNSFDAVIDFDKALRDPGDPISLQPELQSGDFLHPNENGYKMMGEAIDLKLFEL
jgi:lysophospholipase L1-like esterase